MGLFVFFPTNIQFTANVVTDLRDIAELFAAILPTAFINSNSLPHHTQQQILCSLQLTFWHRQHRTITLYELQRYIKNTKHSAVEPNDFHIFMLQHALPYILNTLLKIYNFIWVFGRFPAAWRTATSVPILKANKNPSSLDSYRPISLTLFCLTYLSKLLMAGYSGSWRGERSCLLFIVAFDAPPLTRFCLYKVTTLSAFRLRKSL